MSSMKGGVVGDYVSLQRGKTYSGKLVGEPGPALLGLGSIKPGGGFRHDKVKTFGGECPENLMAYPGDIYVALKGATKDGSMIGSVSRVPDDVESGRLTQDTAKLLFKEPSHEIESHLYWILQTPHYRRYCAARATGSAQVGFSRDDFLAYPVPPITASTRTLTSLFESIEARTSLNGVMAGTLKAITQAVFKSWFVDFDPVHAKVEGRELVGMAPETAALFPDSFQDSSLGRIPMGWQVVEVGECAKLLDHKRIPLNSRERAARQGPY